MSLPGSEVTECSVQEQERQTIADIDVFEDIAVQDGATEFIHGGLLWVPV
jgi:hypothetical protein